LITWDLEELQKVIDEITTAEKLVTVDSAMGDTYVLFKYPPRKYIRLSDIELARTTQRAIKDKFLTEAQMMEQITKRGIWTEKDENKVKAIQLQLEVMRKKIASPDIQEYVKEHFKEKLIQQEEEIYKLEYKKEVMMVNTAERKARQAKYEYLVWACSYDPFTEERLWSDYLTYCRLTDTKLKYSLLGLLLKYLGGRTTEEIRYIARSNLWRFNYVLAQKINTALFPRAVTELTPDQANLSWWSGYYQSIYEMMPEDQPDDDTIHDDTELDKYMERLHQERTKDRQAARTKKRFGSSSAMHMKEVLVMRSNPDYWDMEYDKVAGHRNKGKTDRSIKDDAPPGSDAAKKRTKPIVGSKRFNK
jgi:hypothetical protein